MISVCMATCNGARFIKEQIDSILLQLASDDELIISDDGSTDGTLEIIAEYAADPRVRVLHHQKNPKYAKIRHSRNFYYATDNFENALCHARGDYIFLSDQDDVWMPGRTEKMIKALEENHADCVMCNFDLIDENGNKTCDFYFENIPVQKTIVFNLLYKNFLGSAFAFKKHLKMYVLPFPKKLICHDLWIGTLAVYYKSFFYLNEVLHHYRRHNATVSLTAKERSTNPLWFKVAYRMNLFFQLIARIIKTKRTIK